MAKAEPMAKPEPTSKGYGKGSYNRPMNKFQSKGAGNSSWKGNWNRGWKKPSW